MAYRHYHTVGLVIGHQMKGEANRLYQILTPDFGLIQVLAQGVRLEKSKLRYNLQNYYLANINLIRGREYWRLVGAEKFGSANSIQINFFRKISSVLLRLIHGEESNPVIFSDLSQAWELLSDIENKPEVVRLEDLEIFILIRLLANFGYLALDAVSERIAQPPVFSWPDVFFVVDKRLSLIKDINSSFAASGL